MTFVRTARPPATSPPANRSAASRSAAYRRLTLDLGQLVGTARRLIQLWVGLSLYGVSMVLMVRANLGLDGWDVLHQGLSKLTGLTMGVISIIVGAIVLLGWIPLRERPGVGTITNVFLVGIAFDAAMPHIEVPHSMTMRIATLISGIALCGLATGVYISVGWGPGPRDGLMTGISRRTGWSVRLTRTGLELTVLAVGWTMGGTVGIGTVAFALAIGPLSQLFLRLFAPRAIATAVTASGTGGDSGGGTVSETGGALGSESASGQASTATAAM